MRCSIAMACAVMMLVCGAATHGEQKSAPAKQLQINLRLLEGDPLGSEKEGTLTVKAQPRLVTGENQKASFIDGGEVLAPADEGVETIEYGQIIEIKPGTVKDGKVRLEVTLSKTEIDSRNKDRLQLHTDQTRTIAVVKLGEVLKLRFGKGSADRQQWVELTVEEAKP